MLSVPLQRSRRGQNSAEKKRVRDRRAQQNLRHKRKTYIQSLEERLHLCEELHNPERTAILLQEIQALQEENEALRQQQSHFQQVPAGWEPLPQALEAYQPNYLMPQPTRQNEQGEIPNKAVTLGSSNHLLPIYNSTNNDYNSHNQHSGSFSTELFIGNGDASIWSSDIDALAITMPPAETIQLSHLPSQTTQVEFGDLQHKLAVVSFVNTAYSDVRYAIIPDHPTDSWEQNPMLLPIWSHVPLLTPNVLITLKCLPWDANIDQVLDAPDLPAAKDLLFESKGNLFASSIKRCVKNWICRDVERLAIGWILYCYFKWRSEPTAERFERLPSYYRPVSEDFQVPHQNLLDTFIWPRFRMNMIKYQDQYNLGEMIQLFSLCIRVRWPRDEDIMESNEEDELVVRQEFFDRFMHPDGWGIATEFIVRYPQLFEGLPIDKLVYDY